MRLTRVHVEANLRAGTSVELPPEAGAHLVKVLRARSGDEIILFSGDGTEFPAAIDGIRGSKVTASLREARAIDRESPLAITLVQCVPRGDRMDFIVQKATELGVARIVPVLSQRSVVRLDAAQARSKAAHWRAVAISACEQCGRNRLPLVESPLALMTYLGESSGGGTRLLFDPDAAAPASAQVEGAAAVVAIGPEGGFTEQELEAFRISGFEGMRLGPRILRTETAAITALAWLQSRCGDLGAG